MDSNLKTLETYQSHFDRYIKDTASITTGFQKQWLEYVLSNVNKSARILEIGSAFGWDAEFIRGNGYTKLSVTDAFDAALDELGKKGFQAKKFNVLTDEMNETYDLIIASAVFLHFTATELSGVLNRIKKNLSADNGLLAFSVKIGQGEEWSSHKMDAPRYFHYWLQDELVQFVEENGYKTVDVRQTDDSKWLCATCKVVR